MAPKANACRRCLLPTGKLHVRLDDAGICNYCRHWDATKSSLLSHEEHRPLLVDRLGRYGERFHYDAAVGLSGGKDSAYVLHRLVSSYEANVLSVTFDNGCLSDSAWENVREIVRASGVDHFVYKPDWEAFRTFYRAALRRLGDPCVACSVGGYILSVRGCRDLRIPYFIHGRSPMQLFRSWRPGTRDPSVSILRSNLRPHSCHMLRRQYGAMRRRMRLLLLYLVPNGRLRRRIFHELFGSGTAAEDVVPEFLSFFLFEPYDEQEILRYLAEAPVGYRSRPERVLLGHDDCLIHDACAFLYEQQHGFNRVLPEVAWMLREGLMGQEKASEIIAANTPSEDAVEASIGHLLDRLDMPRSEFDAIVCGLRRKRGPLPFA